MVFPGDLPPSVWGMIWCQGYRDCTHKLDSMVSSLRRASCALSSKNKVGGCKGGSPKPLVISLHLVNCLIVVILIFS